MMRRGLSEHAGQMEEALNRMSEAADKAPDHIGQLRHDVHRPTHYAAPIGADNYDYWRKRSYAFSWRSGMHIPVQQNAHIYFYRMAGGRTDMPWRICEAYRQDNQGERRADDESCEILEGIHVQRGIHKPRKVGDREESG